MDSASLLAQYRQRSAYAAAIDRAIQEATAPLVFISDSISVADILATPIGTPVAQRKKSVVYFRRARV